MERNPNSSVWISSGAIQSVSPASSPAVRVEVSATSQRKNMSKVGMSKPLYRYLLGKLKRYVAFVTSRLVSSFTSLITPSSPVSFASVKPPGKS